MTKTHSKTENNNSSKKKRNAGPYRHTTLPWTYNSNSAGHLVQWRHALAKESEGGQRGTRSHLIIWHGGFLCRYPPIHADQVQHNSKAAPGQYHRR